MKNVLEIIAAQYPAIVAEYKITEAFVVNGDLHITSIWDIDSDTYRAMIDFVAAQGFDCKF